MRRRARTEPTGPVAEIAGYVADLAAAAARGDSWAADNLANARFWRSAATGADRAVADLFAEFARLDRQIWQGIRR